MFAPKPRHISNTIPAGTAITTALAAVMCTHMRLCCHDDTIVVFGMLRSQQRPSRPTRARRAQATNISPRLAPPCPLASRRGHSIRSFALMHFGASGRDRRPCDAVVLVSWVLFTCKRHLSHPFSSLNNIGENDD